MEALLALAGLALAPFELRPLFAVARVELRPFELRPLFAVERFPRAVDRGVLDTAPAVARVALREPPEPRELFAREV